MSMPMGSALPGWLTPVAWAWIGFAMLGVVAIAADIYVRGRRHGTVADELVWVSSALYLGPLAVPAYATWGRAGADDAQRGIDPPRGAAVATLPGGGASAVAHLVAVPFVAAVGWTIAGMAMWPMIVVIFLLATLVLAVYERRSRTAAQGRRSTVGAALLAAAVTVVAFDVGMVGWMVLLHVNDLMPPATEGSFWFLMQVGVIVGLATGYPAVRWLLDREAVVVPA